MNVIAAQRHLDRLRQREQLVRIVDELNETQNRLNREYPFCETCKHRAPRNHVHGWPWDQPLFSEET